MATLVEHCIRPWQEVAAVCRDAAVFLDDGAGELLHWAGGLALLEGSVGVYELFGELCPVARDFISKAPYCHVVIVVTSFLHGRTSERISRLLSDLQPLECHVFCSLSEEMHSELIPMPSEGEGEVEEGVDGRNTMGYSHFGEFQALLKKWTNRESGVRVCVSHLPLFHSEVCPGLFTTPPHSALFPLLPSDVETIQARLINEGDPSMSVEHLHQVDFDMLTREFQTNLKNFTCGLDYLLKSLDMQEEIFSLGTTSRFIGNQLSNLPAARTRRKAAANRCSLVLVDRTLDLTGPSSHPTEALADRILSLLPHHPVDSNDVCVDMSPISLTGGSSDGVTSSSATIIHGSLAQPGHTKAQQVLKTLIHSKQKESMMELSRCLLDSLSQEGLSIKLTGRLARPSAQQLTAFLQQFRGHQDACISQRSQLQLACAVLQTLESPSNKHWEQLASIEKILIHDLADSESPSVVSQLIELTQKQLQSHTPSPPPPPPPPPSVSGAKSAAVGEETSISELLGLAVAMFSLAGVKCLYNDREMKALKHATLKISYLGFLLPVCQHYKNDKEVMTELVLKWRKCDAESAKLLGIEKSDSKARIVGRLSTIFQHLVQLEEAREQLSQFRHILQADDHSPFPYRPLLSQLIDAIFSPSHPDLSDLHYHPHGTTATNIIKSGFSLFMSSVRPRPHQYPTLILFVVGGVCCNEVRQIREILTSRKAEVQVLIGSSKLLTPTDIIKLAMHRENT